MNFEGQKKKRLSKIKKRRLVSDSHRFLKIIIGVHLRFSKIAILTTVYITTNFSQNMKSGHSGLQRLLRNDCIEKKKSFCKACQVFFCRKTRDRELKSEISFYPIKYARKGALKKISFLVIHIKRLKKSTCYSRNPSRSSST